MVTQSSTVFFTQDYAFVYQYDGKLTVHEYGSENACYYFDSEIIDTIKLDHKIQSIEELEKQANQWIAIQTALSFEIQITNIEDKLKEINNLLYKTEDNFLELPDNVQELLDREVGSGRFAKAIIKAGENSDEAIRAIRKLKSQLKGVDDV